MIKPTALHDYILQIIDEMASASGQECAVEPLLSSALRQHKGMQSLCFISMSMLNCNICTYLSTEKKAEDDILLWSLLEVMNRNSY